MPDANKLQSYEDQAVMIARCCATCLYFQHGVGMWGECSRAQYTHLKHVGGPRPLPTNKAMTCPQWAKGEAVATELGDYRELMPWANR